MAEKNIRINVKTNTGYDVLYPETNAEIINFDNSDTTLISKNVNSAIKEVDSNFKDINSKLEDLFVVRSGTSAPDNSLGKNGDIYIQIVE